MKAKGTFKHSKWDEVTLVQISNTQKTSRVSGEFVFLGEATGKALIEFLMFYRRFDNGDSMKAHASYVGMVFFEGKLNGKTGSFVMRDLGLYEDGVAASNLLILNDSGGDELKGIAGTAKYRATAKEMMIEFDYELPLIQEF